MMPALDTTMTALITDNSEEAAEPYPQTVHILGVRGLGRTVMENREHGQGKD